ncbi:Non-specific serine/threonine protein kinase protein [Dioscorea alata]|uniref:Non-specific serine/threonine protein kinase protein n=1 Tax=Dioscorea alata TaxID=55571 RepID=A0ACB7V7K4_DIOAL|nr:Non-specific serine/threonine protein kinase protein [Dioscorea alata]
MALVDFKKHINDPNNKLSSWVGQDCCSWEGVRCDNTTGNVIGLDLRNRIPYYQSHNGSLGGKISPSLLHLQHLKLLDLSRNYFSGTSIPAFISQFKELRYLNLSKSVFNGPIPASLGNLSSLHTLDLSYNGVYDDPAHQWLSRLTSLQLLDMSGVDFGSSSSSSTLFQALNKLPSIKEIRLAECELGSIPLSIPHLNFSSLTVLDLYENSINSSVPGWVFNLTGLEYLDLSYNDFHGKLSSTLASMSSLETLILAMSGFNDENGIPESIRSLCCLKTLDLSGWNISQRLAEFRNVFSGCLKHSLTDLHLNSANLKGDIPDWIGDIKNLKVLDFTFNSLSGSLPSSLAKLSHLEELLLHMNQLNGTLPEEIGQLAELVHIGLSGNQLNGVITEAHFAQQEKLDALDMSGNSLVFNVSSNWIPPFHLQTLRISSCFVGLGFPSWLRKQSRLHVLDMSYTGISETIPDWFWNLTQNLYTLDLSHNQIEGIISKSVSSAEIDKIDLSCNLFYGPFPQFRSATLAILDLSNNSFSGFIPLNIADDMPNLFYLSLARNNLGGTVPSSMCQMRELAGLVLSKNKLTNKIPDCWLNSSALLVFDAGDNHLSGSIPDSLCQVPPLQSLHLGNNVLSGEFPVSLKNCTQLYALDLSDNCFSGSIPAWLAESLSGLGILSLKSNTFIGYIPAEISQLTNLQILDLSSNNLCGPIPRSLGNFSTMKVPHKGGSRLFFVQTYKESLLLNLKGRQDIYTSELLSLVKMIDLSNTHLSGVIPEELASLYGLQGFNISRNYLHGEIPAKLGQLQQLETLDLSRNHFSGSIPATL